MEVEIQADLRGAQRKEGPTVGAGQLVEEEEEWKRDSQQWVDRNGGSRGLGTWNQVAGVERSGPASARPGLCTQQEEGVGGAGCGVRSGGLRQESGPVCQGWTGKQR